MAQAASPWPREALEEFLGADGPDLDPERFVVVAEAPGVVWYGIPKDDGLAAYVEVRHQAVAPEGWAGRDFEACDAELPGPAPDPTPDGDAHARDLSEEDAR